MSDNRAANRRLERRAGHDAPAAVNSCDPGDCQKISQEKKEGASLLPPGHSRSSRGIRLQCLLHTLYWTGQCSHGVYPRVLPALLSDTVGVSPSPAGNMERDLGGDRLRSPLSSVQGFRSKQFRSPLFRGRRDQLASDRTWWSDSPPSEILAGPRQQRRARRVGGGLAAVNLMFTSFLFVTRRRFGVNGLWK